MAKVLTSDFHQVIERNRGTVIHIWFESSHNIYNEFEQTKETLQTKYTCITYHGDTETFIKDMKSVTNKTTIFLITSDDDAPALLSSVHNFRQLDSIFILSTNIEKSKHLFDKFDKIVNIFCNQDELLTSIETNLEDVENQRKMLFSYDRYQQATQDLSEGTTCFRFQLAHDWSIYHLDVNQAREDMIAICRKYYRNNRKFLKQIDDFEQNYNKNTCSQWYTRDGFLYRLINTVLRTKNLKQICKYRYYISDLSDQLKDGYKQMKEGLEDTIQLYRGTTISTKEAVKLRENVGGLIASNGYWSTSRNRSYARTYVDGTRNDAKTTAVLFQIECNLRDERIHVIFADISQCSKFPVEQEVLFDHGAVFKIEKISEEIDTTGVLEIQMRTIGEERRLVDITMKHYKWKQGRNVHQ